MRGFFQHLGAQACVWIVAVVIMLGLAASFDSKERSDPVLVLTNASLLTNGTFLALPIIATNFEYRSGSVVNKAPIVFLGAYGTPVDFDREESVKFALDQVTKIIAYLFAAAVAALGFVVKVLIEPILEKEVKKPMAGSAVVCFWNAALGCCASIVCGIWAYSQFPLMATGTTFSLYDGQVGLPVLFQEITFGIAFFFVLVGIIKLLKR